MTDTQLTNPPSGTAQQAQKPNEASKFKLTFSNIKAIDLNTSEFAGKKETYVRFKLAEEQAKETAVSADHTKLEWNDTIVIESTQSQSIKISAVVSDVKEKNVAADNVVGEHTFNLKEIVAGKSLKQWTLQHNGKDVGHVVADLSVSSHAETTPIDDSKQKKEEEEKAKKAEQEKKAKEEEAAAQKDTQAAKAGTTTTTTDAKRSSIDQQNVHKNNQAANNQADTAKRSSVVQGDQKKNSIHSNQQLTTTQPAETSQHNLSQSMNSGGSHSLRRLDDYQIAKKNLRNGFGMSEYQSANSLQNSVVATSFSKEQRFHHINRQPGPQYIVLPSIFSNSKKGAGFGHGVRTGLNASKNPGPGAYEISNKLFQKNLTTFGESRSRCKNSIAVSRVSQEASYSQPRLMNSKTEVRLPQINRAVEYSQVQPQQNYHYLQSQGTR